jgi:hypothetical protein
MIGKALKYDDKYTVLYVIIVGIKTPPSITEHFSLGGVNN